MAELAWADREDVTVPLNEMWHDLKCGTLVQTEDGREWTVVYRGLGGFGVVRGDQKQFTPTTPVDQLPWPDAWLRQPYDAATLPCVGDQVIVLRSAST